jgi:hypothetical protein
MSDPVETSVKSTACNYNAQELRPNIARYKTTDIKQAIIDGDQERLSLLLSNSDETRNMNLFTLAQKENQGDLFQTLLDYGCDINEQDRDGWTALHHAAANLADQDIKDLVHLGANIEIEDDDGHTAYDILDQEIRKLKNVQTKYLCTEEVEPVALQRSCAASIEDLNRKLDEMREYQTRVAVQPSNKTAAQIWAEKIAPNIGETIRFIAISVCIYLIFK